MHRAVALHLWNGLAARNNCSKNLEPVILRQWCGALLANRLRPRIAHSAGVATELMYGPTSPKALDYLSVKVQKNLTSDQDNLKAQ